MPEEGATEEGRAASRLARARRSQVMRHRDIRRGVRCSGLIVIGLTVTLLVVGASVSIAVPSQEPFAIEPGSFHITPSTYQAGAHANWTLTFDIAHDNKGKTFNDLRSTLVNYPRGFMGNNTAVPACPVALLLGVQAEHGSECPLDTQVGTISLYLTFESVPVYVTFPVFNVEVTSPGVTAELGFNAFIVTQVLPVAVRPGDSGLTGTSPNIVNVGEPHDISLTIWGVPWAHEHDAERGRQCYPKPFESTTATCFGGGELVNMPAHPYLGNPTSCPGTALNATMEADSWEEPLAPASTASTEIGPFVNCERVPFNPSIEVQPTTNSTESPSGLDVSLVVPQSWEKPETIATSTLKDTRVTLPVGYTVNPSAGSGLTGCTPVQYAAETSSSPPGAGCPPESKLGRVKIETPVLAEPIEGNVYLAQPYDNPFSEPSHPNGSLLAMYVVAKAPDRGIIIRAAGKVEPNPITGQLVTTFQDTPQQPFSKFTLSLKQGQTSPLVSPPTCGAYAVKAQLTPWSAPEEPRSLSNEFQIEHGIGGGPCPAGGVPPFKPTVLAGTQSNAGASYSPFYLRITREDGEQELTKFSTTLPPGLTGNLTGIPFCPEVRIEAARQATGQHELREPSCPAASEIGHTLVGAGVGSVLAWTPGKVYMAGPYHGAPFSLVSVTSAAVGPFDLGTVVIRFALRINPLTAQAEVDSSGSDPIPHIIDGIVVHVRDIHVYIDRGKFILNPSSCNSMSISDTVTGAGADFTNPADQVPVTVATPFQAADCQNLKFKPAFKVLTAGKTSRPKGASLDVRLSYPNAAQGEQANIRSVKVDLPKQLPSRLTTLQKACTDATFSASPAACPPASRVGTATATTPILPVPLNGPAYFVSHGGAKFPELVIVLQGYGVTVDLHGETFISKQGITSSTFRSVPDVPVGTFELKLPQGPYSALAANTNLCSITRSITQRKRVVTKIRGRKRTVVKTVHKSVPGILAMPTVFTAQNGAVIHQSTLIAVTGCKKQKAKSGSPHRTVMHNKK
jgi:hypothetical protein